MKTFIDPEEKCKDIGEFVRSATVFYIETNDLVSCKAGIPDTYFSIPAVTKTEHGYIALRKDGELEFRPHTDQTTPPAAYKKAYRKACK